MNLPGSDGERLAAAHRAIQLLLGQAQASAQVAAVAAALEDDPEAAAEVLAATGRLGKASERREER